MRTGQPLHAGQGRMLRGASAPRMGTPQTRRRPRARCGSVYSRPLSTLPRGMHTRALGRQGELVGAILSPESRKPAPLRRTASRVASRGGSPLRPRPPRTPPPRGSTAQGLPPRAAFFCTHLHTYTHSTQHTAAPALRDQMAALPPHLLLKLSRGSYCGSTRQRVRLAPRFHGTQNMQQVLLTPCDTTARVTCANVAVGAMCDPTEWFAGPGAARRRCKSRCQRHLTRCWARGWCRRSAWEPSYSASGGSRSFLRWRRFRSRSRSRRASSAGVSGSSRSFLRWRRFSSRSATLSRSRRASRRASESQRAQACGVWTHVSIDL
jgi:hypothetical protein